jgi:TnpA family transposase
MRLLEILDKTRQKEFDNPPPFDYAQRKFFFSMPAWTTAEIKQIISPVNQVGLVIQIGYFKATGRFFKTKSFNKLDVEFIIRRLNLSINNNDIGLSYAFSTIHRHRQMILTNFGVEPFNDAQKEISLSEAIKFAKRQMRPSAVFSSLAEYLRTHRIELPTYYALSVIITDAFKLMNTELESLIGLHLSETGRENLDELISPQQDSETERTYLLTRIKKSQEVMKPRAIKANIEDYLHLKNLYHELKPLLLVLNLSDEMIAYYAQFVIRSQVFQVYRQENRKYLMLICFIVHQHHFLGDLLVETLLKASQQLENASQSDVKKAIYEKHIEAQDRIDDFMETTSQMVTEAKKMEAVTLDFSQTNEQKVKHFINWVNSDLFRRFTDSQKEIDHFKKGTYAPKDATYYQVLEEKSRKLQTRVAAILRHVDFEIKDAGLEMALVDFKKKDGRLTDNLPDGFLKKQEQQVLKSAAAKSSLYKVFLTQHIAKGIKSGQVNLTASFLYKPFLKYLIDEVTWGKEKTQLLKKGSLEAISDWKTLENDIKNELGTAFAHTFGRIDSGKNKFVELRKDGKPRFAEPKSGQPEGTGIELFPSEGMIPIIEVLNTVNDKCRFTHALQHWNANGRRAAGQTITRPTTAVFLAGLMAYGCNIGVGPMARNSQNISANTLDNTINWYFSLENIQKANDAIVDLMGRLKIGGLFQKDPKILHTSSDGQKFYIQVDSIHANYSFKYFGKEKGIVIYSFIDEMHRLFYSTSFSSSHREAAYVIDGLMHNQVVESDIHSTDTHGYTEAIFALTHLLGIQFAPRIADFQNLIFYPFPGTQVETLKTYELKVGKPVNTKLIEEYWDQILRLVTSIKLKHTTASTVLKRLNSYALQNPLYQALKELGKGIRTLFLLRYMDDEMLRQRINQQNNKTENSHQFARAVFYANSGEIRFASHQEHLITDASKRLIQNAVICWNYLHLSKSIIDAPVGKRDEIINTIKKTSPVSWSHINLHGKFDFSEDALGNAETFNLEEILNLEFDK